MRGRALLLPALPVFPALVALVVSAAAPLPARAGAAETGESGPARAEALVAEARAASGRGEHAAAAELMMEALEEDPSRRGDWIIELAEQMTYSGRARNVVFLYGELLAANRLRRPRLSPEEERRVQLGRALALSWSGRLDDSLAVYEALLARDEDDRLARLGRARVLSWMGRQQEAHEAYREVLRRYPEDPEALLGLARVQSWRGRQRQAQGSLESYLEDHPGNSEAAVLLAQSQYWMGRPDRARRTLDRPPAAGERRYSGALRDRLALEIRPDLRLDFEEAHQKDNVDDPLIRTFTLEQAFHWTGGRTTLGPRYQHVRYDPELQPSQFVEVLRPGLFGRHRFSDPVELVGRVSMDLIRPEIGEDHDTLTYDVYAAYQPGDLLAFYFGSSRTTFESVRALTLNTTATYASFALAATPDDRSRFDLRLNGGDYSDGNTRLWAQFQGERRVSLAPRIFLGGLVTGYRFSELLDSGYFNPERYVSAVATFRAYAWSERPFFWDVYATLGGEWATPGGRQTAWSATARVGYRITRKLVIRGRAGYVNAATASNTGYARGSAGLDLHLIW